jgi:hypothetical protein
MLWRRPKPEPPLKAEDVDIVMGWMWDVRAEIVTIRTLLEERYGEEDSETDS